MAIAEDPKTAQLTERPSGEGLHGARGPAELARDARTASSAQGRLGLSDSERRLLSDLFAIVSEHAADSAVEIDRERVQDAFVFACEHHAAQRRKSGEDFIVHPVGVARICTTRSRTPPPRSRRCASASARRYRASSTG